MKEYTYKDLLAMQEQAKQRVMEMQKRSKFAVEDMNRDFDYVCDEERNDAEIKKQKTFSAHTVGLAQQPRNIQYPTGIVNSEREKQKHIYEKNGSDVTNNGKNENHNKKHQKKNDILSQFFNVFGKMSGDESEKMLILSLCLLLANEQADENLIIALLYLIA